MTVSRTSLITEQRTAPLRLAVHRPRRRLAPAAGAPLDLQAHRTGLLHLPQQHTGTAHRTRPRRTGVVQAETRPAPIRDVDPLASRSAEFHWASSMAIFLMTALLPILRGHQCRRPIRWFARSRWGLRWFRIPCRRPPAACPSVSCPYCLAAYGCRGGCCHQAQMSRICAGDSGYVLGQNKI